MSVLLKIDACTGHTMKKVNFNTECEEADCGQQVCLLVNKTQTETISNPFNMQPDFTKLCEQCDTRHNFKKLKRGLQQMKIFIIIST